MHLRPPTPLIRTTFGLASVALATVTHAQTSPPFQLARSTRVAVSSDPPSFFWKCGLANLTPDLRTDALVSSGPQWLCVSGVENLGVVIPLQPVGGAALITDAAVLPSAGRDRVVCLQAHSSGATDLIELEFQSAAEGSSGVDEFVLAPGSTPILNIDAGILAVGDFDGDGAADVFVASGNVCSRYERSGAGSYTLIDSFPVAGETFEIRLEPFSSSVRDDLLSIDESSVRVYALGASAPELFTFAKPVQSVASWYCSFASAGRLAVATREFLPAGTLPLDDISRLEVCGVGYSEPTLSLGGLQVNSVAASDLFGIGSASLITLNNYGPVSTAFFNFGGPPSGSSNTFNVSNPAYGAAREFDIDAGTSMSSQLGRVTAGDVDGDGDIDIVFPCDATGDVHVLRSPIADETASGIVMENVKSVYDNLPWSIAGWGQSFVLQFAADSIPANATHVQANLFQVVGSGAVVVNPAPELDFVGSGLWAVSALTQPQSGVLETPDASRLEALSSYVRHYAAGNYDYAESAHYFLYIRPLKQLGVDEWGSVGPEWLYRFGHSRTSNDADSEPDTGNPDPIEPEPTPPPPPRRQPPSSP